MLLKMSSVAKSFADADKRVVVLKDIALTVAGGETVALTGESGSGKSTLLNIAAGLETADAGQVEVLGHDTTRLGEAGLARMRRQDLAVVFQQFNLIPSMTVAQNIAFHAKLAGRYDPDLAHHLTVEMGVLAHLSKYPEALSGGQQQRVAILRALVAQPRLLLADEPTGNLDEATADQVMAQMRSLIAETGAGLLIVTHSEKVAAMIDRRYHLHGGILE